VSELRGYEYFLLQFIVYELATLSWDWW